MGRNRCTVDDPPTANAGGTAASFVMMLSVAGAPERHGVQTRPAINNPATAITRRTQIVAPMEASKFTRPMAAIVNGAAVAN
jgi:hypothetical protein